MTLSIHSSDCLFHSLSQRIKDKLGLKLLFCVCYISFLIVTYSIIVTSLLESIRVGIYPTCLNPLQNIPKLNNNCAFILADLQNNRTSIKHCPDLEFSKRKKISTVFVFCFFVSRTRIILTGSFL